MTTARDLITQALGSLGVLHGGEEPGAQEADDSLVVLNQMLSGWIHDGIDLEFIDLALNDEVPYPPDHIAAFRYNLAMTLAPEFGVQPSIVLAQLASDGYERMRREYMDNRILETDDAIVWQTNRMGAWS